VLALAAARDANLGSGAVTGLMGGSDAFEAADPSARIPLGIPVRCIHGVADDVVPISQSIDYVERARGAGADAELILVDGDHFVIIDPSSQGWARTLEVLEAL
jgi:fermentation-respiration switch protein FrsA (DUF1100 family)